MHVWKLTDEEIIERIRREQRYRWPIGITCAIVGIAGLVVTFSYIQLIVSLSHDMTSPMEPPPTTQQIARQLDQSRFYVGIALGFILAEGLTSFIGLAGVGLWMFRNNRKDKMLLKYWDANRPANQES